MRILFINYEFPPLGGGAGVAMQYLLKGLAESEGFAADLVTSSVDRHRVDALFSNLRIHYLDIGKRGSFHYQSNRDLLVYSAKAYLYAKRLVRKERYDLVHAFFGIPCGVVAARLGLPYIVSLRGSDVPFYNKRFETLDRLLFQRMSRRLWKNAAAVVANSEGLKALAQETSPSRRIEIIPNGVDVDLFFPPETKVEREKKILISTGRLIERKGYHFLIEALEGLDGFELRLVGDGNRRGGLEALAKAKGVEVAFLGKREREELPAILRNADIFVLPSQNEGMSNSLLEAVASGLPVIVTDVGGSAEIVKGNGYVVEKASAPALREALKHYQEDPSLIPVHGRASREIALTMSWRNMGERYLALYRSLTE